MKPRRVIIIIEIETDWTIRQIQTARLVFLAGAQRSGTHDIIQIQANAIRDEKRKAKR